MEGCPVLSLQEADAWVGGARTLLAYQALLLEQKSFSLRMKSGVYKVINVQALGGNNLLLLRREGAQQTFIYQTQGAAHGYPLQGGSFLLPENVVAEWPDSEGRAPVIRIGHRNFAHFIWNELDALLTVLVRKNADELVDIFQDHNSIFDLSRLDGVRCQNRSVLKIAPSLRVGSRLVTERVRQLVFSQYAESFVSNSSRQSPLASPVFKLLLGVRGPGKRAIQNEKNFYKSLLRNISQVAPHVEICWDGLTLSNDYHPSHSDVLKRCNQCSVIIKELTSFSESLGIKSRNLNGLHFDQWLQVVAGIDFYVTHEGTMQHKIGWLFPKIPGLLLIGRKNSRAIARWHASQVEHGVDVSCLPDQYLKAGDLPGSSKVERDRMSIIKNIDSSVQFVIDLLLARREFQ